MAWGGKLPFQQEHSLGCPTPLMALPRHRDTTKWPLPSSFSAFSCQNDTTTNSGPACRQSPGWGTLQPHGTSAHTKTSARSWQRASPRQFKAKGFLFMSDTHTHAKQQIVSSQLLGQQHYFHTNTHREK